MLSNLPQFSGPANSCSGAHDKSVPPGPGSPRKWTQSNAMPQNVSIASTKVIDSSPNGHAQSRCKTYKPNWVNTKAKHFFKHVQSTATAMDRC